MVYAPVWWKECFVTPYDEKRVYAPASCNVVIFRPSSQPSDVTASAISMCHGARVDEARNSSSRVQRHLTGRCALIASSVQIVSVAVSTFPPKPPPTVPPTNFSRLSGHWRCAATTPIEKYIACVQE